jgi:hypothetical protein
MTYTFLDREGGVFPIRGGEAILAPSLSSDLLKIAIVTSACASEMTLPACLERVFQLFGTSKTFGELVFVVAISQS